MGSNRRAATPPANAEKDARTKAGRLPPPNSASQGPIPTDTIICGMTIERFNTPIDKPWPPPAVEVKVAVKANGTLYVTARGAPSTVNTNKAMILRAVGGDEGALLRISAAFVIRTVHASERHRIVFASANNNLGPNFRDKYSTIREVAPNVNEFNIRPSDPALTPWSYREEKDPGPVGSPL